MHNPLEWCFSVVVCEKKKTHLVFLVYPSVTLTFGFGFEHIWFWRLYLTEIIIPNSVVTIGYATFVRCTGLVKVDIGEGVQEIDEYILQDANSLTTIICRATTPPSIKGETFYGLPSAAEIYVPDASVEAYKAAANWSTHASRIKPLSEYVES